MDTQLNGHHPHLPPTQNATHPSPPIVKKMITNGGVIQLKQTTTTTTSPSSSPTPQEQTQTNGNTSPSIDDSTAPATAVSTEVNTVDMKEPVIGTTTSTTTITSNEQKPTSDKEDRKVNHFVH